MSVIHISKVTHMTQDDIEIIGKNVKDMYGTFMGKVAGTITDIDGTIQSVGVDCGSQGLDRKSTRLNSSHSQQSRMPSSA